MSAPLPRTKSKQSDRAVAGPSSAVPASRANLLLAAVLLAVLLAYSNHFTNAFHFDDFHTITDNPWIRNIRNIPRFFLDATTMSTLPLNRAYRPLVTASLAIDYWLGGGYKPLFFHISTFIWFLAQLILMFFLFRALFDYARPDPVNTYIALFATALYGLHPAIAETVNYIVQRADLYSTLGVVAGLSIYVARPALRRYGLYLIPVALALLSKPPALVFPIILFLYVFLFEGEPQRGRLGAALKASIPSVVVTAALMILQYAMTPSTYAGGAASAYGYRITQPFVALHYFAEFFLPLWLSVDTDRQAFNSAWSPGAVLGFAFVVGIIAAAIWLTRRRETRPIAFGIYWFILALLPTSLFPLAEVENDHRMCFPFIGLALSVPWSAALLLRHRIRPSPLRNNALTAAAVCVLIAYGCGAYARNTVWHTDESLWFDVTRKSPRNGRGLMNYGLTQMSKGDTQRALNYFQRASVFTPNYPILEINLGIANGALGHDADAEAHFHRAISLAPRDAQTHFYYGRWLRGKRRTDDAIRELQISAALNASDLNAKYLLMQIYAEQRAWMQLTKLANSVLAIVPGDAVAAGYLKRAQSGGDDVAEAQKIARVQQTPEAYLDLSLRYHQAGKYRESIDAAKQALRLKPDYAEAYNNMAAAYEELSMWDEAIAAAEEAIRLKPDFTLARNNLAWSLEQKQKAAAIRR
ncbi:MAG TPA: tetratricopeptide repeat protein [Bryobacteraceae bacterium]|nr:tetratricopeptide repeat protein [Bryobacteraceae bacterium]